MKSLSSCQRASLTLQSAVGALVNPYRGDLVAVVGETTGLRALARMRNQMLLSTTGRRILKQRPIVHSSTIDLNKLRTLPPSKFGHKYVAFLDEHEISPDTRSDIKYIEDPELAYVMTRYRQIHDFWHVLVELPISVEAEIGLKWFEYFQTGLPMNAMAALVGPLNLSAQQREVLFEYYVPWALTCASNSKSLMNVFYEELFEVDFEELQKELKIRPFKHSI